MAAYIRSVFTSIPPVMLLQQIENFGVGCFVCVYVSMLFHRTLNARHTDGDVYRGVRVDDGVRRGVNLASRSSANADGRGRASAIPGRHEVPEVSSILRRLYRQVIFTNKPQKIPGALVGEVFCLGIENHHFFCADDFLTRLPCTCDYDLGIKGLFPNC